MKIGIDCPYNGISQKQTSHRASWAHIRKNQLEHQYPGAQVKVLASGEDWNDYEQVYLYMGMEWKDALQFPGGLQQKNLDDIWRLIQYQGELHLLDEVPVSNFYDMLRSRKDFDNFIPNHPNIDADHRQFYKVASRLNHTPTFGSIWDQTLSGKVVVIGDSHANSLYTPGAVVLRNDFKTLHGALEFGLETFLTSRRGKPGSLVFYFGNIDIRHHICRLYNDYDSRKEAVRKLVAKYCDQAKALRDKYDCPITIASPLWIEHEDRQIPKTGWHKGKPFHGSQQDRADIVDVFRDALISDIGTTNVFAWPLSWLQCLRTMTEDVLEKPRSVHLSPSWYPYNLFKDGVNEWWSHSYPHEVNKLKKAGGPIC